ncbi:MAG: hypothetical protein J2P57_09095 [Acidimicrobiaceae bacterium]|nr:hypothetical protein [Acidimicrobiaceae bacterium]
MTHMQGVRGDLELLDLHRQTAFTFDQRGRMIYERAPDRSRGPRFRLAGCPEGNLAIIRDDVPDDAAEKLERLVALEPPLWWSDATALRPTEYLAALEVDGPVNDDYFGLLWVFPSPLAYDTGVRLVWSDTDDGDRLLDRFADAVPASLVEAGFRTPADLWQPWCVAVVGDQIVSIAETVRKGPRGAEVGVDTEAGVRGRGLGSAATAGWSRHPHLHGLTKFYSTTRTNTSSRRVTERLALRFLGSTFSIP